jgi:hypothetical protein
VPGPVRAFTSSDLSDTKRGIGNPLLLIIPVANDGKGNKQNTLMKIIIIEFLYDI